MNNPHLVLGVPANATVAQVKTAFRQLARRHHPDHGGDAKTFKRINEAYRLLLDRLERGEPAVSTASASTRSTTSSASTSAGSGSAAESSESEPRRATYTTPSGGYANAQADFVRTFERHRREKTQRRHASVETPMVDETLKIVAGLTIAAALGAALATYLQNSATMSILDFLAHFVFDLLVIGGFSALAASYSMTASKRDRLQAYFGSAFAMMLLLLLMGRLDFLVGTPPRPEATMETAPGESGPDPTFDQQRTGPGRPTGIPGVSIQ